VSREGGVGIQRWREGAGQGERLRVWGTVMCCCAEVLGFFAGGAYCTTQPSLLQRSLIRHERR